MRDVANVSMLSPDQEQSLANTIAQRRVQYWTTLLSIPPVGEAICALMLPELEKRADKEKYPGQALQHYRGMATSMPAETCNAANEAFEAASSTLAQALGEIDLDGDLSEEVFEELRKLARALSSKPNPASKHSANDSGANKCRLALAVPPDLPRLSALLSQARNDRRLLGAAKNHFVRANLRLVISIARRFDHGLMPLQDIIQEGNIGLMKAVDRFDARLGFRFSTYASWWIRHAINRALANKGRTVRLPAHVSADLQRIGRARREIEARTGKKATPQELAKHSDLSLTRVQKLLRLALEPTVSLDSPIGQDDARGLIDLLVDMQAEVPGEQLESRSIQMHLREAMARLQPIELDILCKRYGINADEDFEPMTLRQLGELHSLSRERIRQLQERALNKLRSEFNRREIIAA